MSLFTSDAFRATPPSKKCWASGGLWPSSWPPSASADPSSTSLCLVTWRGPLKLPRWVCGEVYSTNPKWGYLFLSLWVIFSCQVVADEISDANKPPPLWSVLAPWLMETTQSCLPEWTGNHWQRRLPVVGVIHHARAVLGAWLSRVKTFSTVRGPTVPAQSLTLPVVVRDTKARSRLWKHSRTHTAGKVTSSSLLLDTCG